MMTFEAPSSSSWAQTTSWVLHEDKGVLSGEDEDWDEEKIEELVKSLHPQLGNYQGDN